MKKFIVGLIVGVCVMLPIHAIADSLVGKQVDMIAPVKLDGEYLSVDAIGIKGTTYAPVRAISEALGKDVDWIDGEVIIETPDEEETPTTVETEGDRVETEGKELPEVIEPDESPVDDGIDRIAILESSIRSNQETIELYRYTMQFNEQNGASAEANQEIEVAIQRLEQEIAEYEKRLEELQDMLTE